MPLSARNRIYIIGLALGVINYFSWFWFNAWISGSPLMAFYIAPVFSMFAICGKNCEGSLPVLSAFACVATFWLQWILILILGQWIIRSASKKTALNP